MGAVGRLELAEKPVTQLAIVLSVRHNQLHKWQARLHSKGRDLVFRGFGAKPLSEHSGLERPRRESKRVMEQHGILEQAAVYVAKNLFCP